MDKNIGKYIAERLKILRENQQFLADAVGVSVNAVSKWTKSGNISRKNVPAVAKALGVSVDTLLSAGGNEDGQLPPEYFQPSDIPGTALIYVNATELALITNYKEATDDGKKMIELAASSVPKRKKLLRAAN